MTEERTTSSTGGQKGVKLARFDLIPVGPLRELAEHYGKGARKYDNHQWRQGYEWGKSYAALLRHLTDFWSGKDYDVCSNDPDGCSFVDSDGNPFEPAEPDTCYNHTGSHHMVAVAWHAFGLLEFKDVHPDHDDRFKPEPQKLSSDWVDMDWVDETGIHSYDTHVYIPEVPNLEELVVDILSFGNLRVGDLKFNVGEIREPATRRFGDLTDFANPGLADAREFVATFEVDGSGETVDRRPEPVESSRGLTYPPVEDLRFD